uniref:(northern house mosquito) hypothetical protein n=1 Tax=Culex pipiens TaxID=7175 RepID=A0A8D8C9Y7_CULPI
MQIWPRYDLLLGCPNPDLPPTTVLLAKGTNEVGAARTRTRRETVSKFYSPFYIGHTERRAGNRRNCYRIIKSRRARDPSVGPELAAGQICAITFLPEEEEAITTETTTTTTTLPTQEVGHETS